MTNKELSNFKFVNRTTARKTANTYLHNNQKSILAVFGKNKVGKDYFIDQLEKENKRLTFISFDFKDIYINPIKYILETLYKRNNNEFMLFVKKNYKKIINNSTTIIDLICKTDFSKIFNCLNDVGCTFVNSEQYQESPIRVICKYIKETATYENAVFVFKNLTDCEKVYVHNLFEIIATVYEFDELNIRFILSFDEDIYNDKDFFGEHLEKFHYIPLNIERFDDSKFFLEILKDIFDITAKNKNYLEHLFKVCEGYPGELKSILNKAYKISCQSFEGQANIFFDESLIEKAIKLTKGNFTLNPLEKIILTIVLFVECEFSYEQLLNIISFVLKGLHIVDLEISVEKTLQNLLFEKQLLEYDYLPNNNFQRIKFDSNSNQDIYISVCQSDKIFPQLSNYILLYIKDNESLFIKNMDNYYANLAFFSWKAQSIDWIETNYQVGLYFFDKNELSLSENIFLRITNFIINLAPQQIYKMLLCFYNTGNYRVAFEIVSNKSTENIKQYDYLLLKIKILNINMKKNEAICLIDTMLTEKKYSKHTERLLDLKQRILSNIRERRAEAKIIFDHLLADYLKGEFAYNDFLISSMEYYRGNCVQQNFAILEKKYKKSENYLMLGELLTNKGFDLFWQGKIQKAMDAFSESIKILELLRIHETSYTLNNYANCLMMLGDYETAIKNLNSALVFNESSYAKVTIKTNLMVCYALIEDLSYEKLFSELKQYIKDNEDNNIDISILLKVKYALGFIQEFCNKEITESENFCEEAINEANRYEPTTLPFLWLKDWREDVEIDILQKLDKNEYPEFYNYRFEPWLLTITHD